MTVFCIHLLFDTVGNIMLFSSLFIGVISVLVSVVNLDTFLNSCAHFLQAVFTHLP